MLRATLICLLLTFTATVVAEDSPLVALAKRTNRAKPKAKVITNETLTKDDGRFSTTATQPQINVPPPSAAPTTASKSKPAPAPAAQPKPADSYATGQVRTDLRGMQWVPATASNPQTSQNIAPVSTQKPVAVESPYKPTEAPSSAKSITPDSTARVITPESSQSQSAAPPQ